MLKKLKKELQDKSDPEKAKLLQRFFKTGKGEYGEGDVFLGIVVPESRAISKRYSDLKLKDIKELLKDNIHEHRLVGLLILVDKYDKANAEYKKKIYEFYLKNAERVNNWDLVDLTSHKIVGHFLKDKPRDILYQLADSDNLWKKRISVVSTFHFIKDDDFKDSLKLAEKHLSDTHDLMHKAVGWMLREIGKKDIDELKRFLKKNYKQIPRTTLRYAIERFPEEERKRWLKGEI